MTKEMESEVLIEELGVIINKDGWRDDIKKALRVRDIKRRLGEIFREGGGNGSRST